LTPGQLNVEGIHAGRRHSGSDKNVFDSWVFARRTFAGVNNGDFLDPDHGSGFFALAF
jgi:hypothetical protein